MNENIFNRVAANGECLALQTYWNKKLPRKNSILLIFIHGDGIPGGGPADYLKYTAAKFVEQDIGNYKTFLEKTFFYELIV